MSTMVLNEVLSYYVNNGGSVFCTFLVASNAFDRVNYSQLFKLLVHRMFQSVSVRLALNVYISHICRVSWNGVSSVRFSVLNGVKHGKVISTVLFVVFISMNFFLNWLMQELADLLGIFSLVLLQTQTTLCYQLLRLGLCDLCSVFVIIML